MLPDGYSMIPAMMLAPGKEAQVNVFIYMPVNRNLVHFKRKGEVVSNRDFAKLGGLSPFQVLTPTSDYREAMTVLSSAVVAGVSSSGEVSREVRGLSEGLMLTLTGDEEAVTLETATVAVEKARATLDETATLVQDVIQTYRPVAESGAANFEKILASLKQNDPIMTHNRHVGALCGLLMLSVGGFTMDEIADVSFAGFIHDFCLTELPPLLVGRHLAADDLTLAALKSPEFGYSRHTDLIVKKLTREGIPISPGALQIIEQHHENFDGTGLKGLEGAQICRSARLLRIADDLVSLMNRPIDPKTLKSAMSELWKLMGFGRNIYDPVMLSLVRNAVLKQV